MPNTITAMEGFDTDSYLGSITPAPSVAYVNFPAGYSGSGRCWSANHGNTTGYVQNFSIRTHPTTFTPVSGTTWFIASFMFSRVDGNSSSHLATFGNAAVATAGSTLPSNSASRMAIGYDTAGSLRVVSSSASYATRAEILLPSQNVWYHIEYRHRWGNASTGNWEVYLNGSLLASGVGDNSAITPSWAGFIISPAANGRGSIDNIVLAVSNDASPALIGPCEVRTYIPTSTSVGQWLGSDGDSTDNHLLVDDGNSASADYVEATAGTGLFDLYGHAAGEAPVAVQARAAATVDALGVDDFSLSVRSGASTSNSRRTVPGGAAAWLVGDPVQNDPATGTAWTKAGFDASTFGVKS